MLRVYVGTGIGMFIGIVITLGLLDDRCFRLIDVRCFRWMEFIGCSIVLLLFHVGGVIYTVNKMSTTELADSECRQRQRRKVQNVMK